jgi:O-antigen/teichoic acid export membrane protein
MSGLRSVGKHTLIYGMGMLASRLASFIMLPVYTRYLTPADYGVLELLTTTIDVIGLIASIGLAGGVFKHHAGLKTDAERHELFSTVALTTLATGAAVMVAGFFAAPSLTRLVFDGEQPSYYFRIFFIIYFLQSFTNIGFLLIQAQERSQLFVTLSVGKLLAALSLNILFVVYLRMGVLGVLIGNVISTGILASGLAYYTFKRTGVAFSRARLRQLATFGAPIAAWSIASFILTFSDRYFLNYYFGSAPVGIYSLAYKFSFLLSAFAATPIMQIWEPRRFQIIKQPDGEEAFRRMFLYLNVSLIGGATLIMLFIRDGLSILAGPAFLSAHALVPLLLLTTVVQQWTAFCNIGLYIKDATKLYAWSGVIGVGAALLLNVVLIPRFGAMGAAWATVLAYAVRFIAVYSLAQSRHFIRYAWPKIIALLSIAVIAWSIRRLADSLPMASSIAVSCLVSVGLVAVIFFAILTPHDRAIVVDLVRKPVIPRPARS